MLYLIDADIFAYRATSAAETEINWYGDIWSLFMDMKDAKSAFQFSIDKIINRLGKGELLFCLSCHEGNFRRDIDPGYKSNRKGTRKPVGYVAFCDWLKEEYRTISKPNLEADDVMGILGSKPENAGKVTIVSDDKDMRTINSRLYRPMADELLDISEQEADRFFLTQALTGDQVDGIPGLKGVGPKTAEKILGNRPSWGAVEQAYIKAGLTRDDALKQARLVRILRWNDYDHKEGRPKLWLPNT